MYEIRKDGGVIALTEAPDYIRRHPDGFWLLCGEDEAEGVAVGGTPMLLSQIILVKRDTGTFLQENQAASAIAFVTLAENGSIDGVTAGEHAELFSPWEYPVAYTAGQIRERSGKLYLVMVVMRGTDDRAREVEAIAQDMHLGKPLMRSRKPVPGRR